MKQFIAFAGFNYYPSGGIHDMKGDYDSIDDAVDRIKEWLIEDSGDNLEDALIHYWWHIYDVTNKTILDDDTLLSKN